MEYARRRCGRSCLGPGFESPRLHFSEVHQSLAESNRAPLFSFSEGKRVHHFQLESIATRLLSRSGSSRRPRSVPVICSSAGGDTNGSLFGSAWRRGLRNTTLS